MGYFSNWHDGLRDAWRHDKLGQVTRDVTGDVTRHVTISWGLNKLTRHKTKQILIVGDFNIDLLNYETDECARELIDTTSKHGFSQVISRPTRITDHSATLIDNIYTNKIHRVLSTSVVTLYITDHLGTYIKLSLDTLI